MTYEHGTLVAVQLDGQIVCIGRILSDDGTTATVRSDDQLEGEAAREYGFAAPPARTMTVASGCLRRIVPRVS